MLLKEPEVTVSVFGDRRYRSKIGAATTVADLLGEHGVETRGRRVAVNGHSVGVDAPVHVGDELTVVPRVQGG